MARRTLYLPVLIVAAVLMGCAPAVLAVSGKAKAAFPGKNGKIAYVRNDGNDYEIYAIDGGGGDKTQLTNDNTGNYAPSYSPGGKKIAYSGSSGSGDTEIYTIDAGGGGKTPLTRNDRDDFYPSYSPNGKKIVYMHDGANDSELYTIDVRTRHRVQLTRNDRDDFYPSYSPSGKKIVCSGSSSSGDTEIYTIDAGGGGGKIQLTHNNTDEFDPDYSPDGKRIAYTGLNRNYDKSAIYKISVDGRGKFRVTPRLKYAESPSWGSRP